MFKTLHRICPSARFKTFKNETSGEETGGRRLDRLGYIFLRSVFKQDK